MAHPTRQDLRHRLCRGLKQVGVAYVKCHNCTAKTLSNNIWTKFGFQILQSKWEMVSKVVENDRDKILWVFLIQTDQLAVVFQLDIVVQIWKKRSLKKIWGWKEEVEKMWEMKATLALLIISVAPTWRVVPTAHFFKETNILLDHLCCDYRTHLQCHGFDKLMQCHNIDFRQTCTHFLQDLIVVMRKSDHCIKADPKDS